MFDVHIASYISNVHLAHYMLDVHLAGYILDNKMLKHMLFSHEHYTYTYACRITTTTQ